MSSAGEDDKQTAGPAGRGPWDFATVVVVLAFLAGISAFLVSHYSKASDAGTILGILVPAVGAIFGVTIGYRAGNAQGKATGKEAGKNEVKGQLGNRLNALDSRVADFVQRVQTGGESGRGRTTLDLGGGVEMPHAELNQLRTEVAETKSFVEAL